MFILCDTSAILMLLRIAPDMFKIPAYECVTIRQIRDEIFKTAKLGKKYDWLEEKRGEIRALPATASDSPEAKLNYEAITKLNDYGIINPNTQKLFDLSAEDRWAIACAVALGYTLGSGDRGQRDFAVQQFDAEVAAPLETQYQRIIHARDDEP